MSSGDVRRARREPEANRSYCASVIKDKVSHGDAARQTRKNRSSGMSESKKRSTRRTDVYVVDASADATATSKTSTSSERKTSNKSNYTRKPKSKRRSSGTVDAGKPRSAETHSGAEARPKRKQHKGLRIFLIVVAFVAVAVLMLYSSLQQLYAAWRTNSELSDTYDELVSENEELNDELERLQTLEGIEDEARDLGYVEEGETGVIVEGLDDDSDDEEEEEESDPWYIVFGDFIFQYGEE